MAFKKRIKQMRPEFKVQCNRIKFGVSRKTSAVVIKNCLILWIGLNLEFVSDDGVRGPMTESGGGVKGECSTET